MTDADLRAAWAAAWRRAWGQDGVLSANLARELAGLPRPRVTAADRARWLALRSKRLGETPPCMVNAAIGGGCHEGDARGCEHCAWLDPAWCLTVVLCGGDEPGAP